MNKKRTSKETIIKLANNYAEAMFLKECTVELSFTPFVRGTQADYPQEWRLMILQGNVIEYEVGCRTLVELKDEMISALTYELDMAKQNTTQTETP